MQFSTITHSNGGKQKGDAMKKFLTGCLTVAAVIAAAVTVFILLIGRKGNHKWDS